MKPIAIFQMWDRRTVTISKVGEFDGLNYSDHISICQSDAIDEVRGLLDTKPMFGYTLCDLNSYRVQSVLPMVDNTGTVGVVLPYRDNLSSIEIDVTKEFLQLCSTHTPIIVFRDMGENITSISLDMMKHLHKLSNDGWRGDQVIQDGVSYSLYREEKLEDYGETSVDVGGPYGICISGHYDECIHITEHDLYKHGLGFWQQPFSWLVEHCLNGEISKETQW